MDHIMIRIDRRRFMVWSLSKHAPVTYCMSKKVAVEYLMSHLDTLPKSALAEANETTTSNDMTLEEVLADNQAGPKGRHLRRQAIIPYYWSAPEHVRLCRKKGHPIHPIGVTEEE